MRIPHRPRRLAALAAIAALSTAQAAPALAQGMGGALQATQPAPAESSADAPAVWEQEMRDELNRLNAGGELDADGFAAMSQVLGLLDLPRLPFTKADDITGKWRIRSIQVGQYGVFAYPFFGAVVKTVPGGLVFDKNTGSQRRAGSLTLDEAGRYAFMGGYYMQGEPANSHSSTKPNPTDEDRERDSEGVIINLGPGHALLLFRSKFFQGTTYSGEIYELKR